MEINLNKRRIELDNLNQFIWNTEKKIGSILSALSWDGDNLKKKTSDMVTCPLNKEHYVIKDKLEKHLGPCTWSTEGYRDDVALPESCGPGGSSIVLDVEMRTNVIREAMIQDPTLKTDLPAVGLDDRAIPKTADRITSDFTVDERRVLYDFAIMKTNTAPSLKVEELDMPFKKEEKQKPKTYLERLAEERDAKRRKVSKKVHTNRKSQMEILREVINNQMEAYEEYLKQEFPELRKSPSHSHHSPRRLSPTSKIPDVKQERSINKQRSESRVQHSSNSEQQLSPVVEPRRRVEYNRTNDRRSYRERRLDAYHEDRRDYSERTHSQKERYYQKYYDGRNDKAKMYNAYSKKLDQDAEDNHSHSRKYRERSKSYESERTHIKDRSDSYDLQTEGSIRTEDCRGDKRYRSRSNNYRYNRSEKHRDKSSSYETQERERNEKSSENSDFEDRRKSKREHSNVKKHKAKDYEESSKVLPDTFYTNLHNIKSEDNGLQYNKRRIKHKVYENKSNVTEEEDSDNVSDSHRHRGKGKHKRKKHKKNKKHHKKTSYKSDQSEHSSDDFSC